CRRTGGGSEQRRKNLSASGGCRGAQVHYRTQDNGLDRHAPIRVNAPRRPVQRLRPLWWVTSRPLSEHSMRRKRISCRSYATKLDRSQTRIAASQSSARQSLTAMSPISPASPPIRLLGISKPKLLKCCDASMSFSTSLEPTNHIY